jgi:hypothetical protein
VALARRVRRGKNENLCLPHSDSPCKTYPIIF